jgi:citrate lyase synthetase
MIYTDNNISSSTVRKKINQRDIHFLLKNYLPENKQEQTNKQTNKETNKQTNKQT